MANLRYWFPEGEVTRNHREDTWDFKVRNRYTKRFYRKSDAVEFARKELQKNTISTLTVRTARDRISYYLESRLFKEIISDKRDLELEVHDLRKLLDKKDREIASFRECFGTLGKAMVQIGED